MIRNHNYKVLSLAILAIAAVSLVMASAATARPEFTASAYPATVTGSNTNGSEVFSTEAGNVECDSHFVSHSISEASWSLGLTPTYSSCTAFGFLEATVSTEGCEYEISPHQRITFWEYIHWFDINCPSGKSIKIKAGTCAAEFKSQIALAWFDTINQANGTMTLQPDVSWISYTVTQDGFLCPFNGTGAKTDGFYDGDVLVSRVGGGSFSVSGEW